MTVIIIPGIHPPELTQSFLQGIKAPENWLIFPTEDYPAYSAIEVLKFLKKSQTTESVLFISFSAGVVGGIGAAIAYQLSGIKVKAFIAVDGWGVPLTGNFPIHRVSHDFFTHWSTFSGADSFYAEPGVEHRYLWSNPQTTVGWWVKSPGLKVRCTAAEFFRSLLAKYEEM